MENRAITKKPYKENNFHFLYKRSKACRNTEMLINDVTETPILSNRVDNISFVIVIYVFTDETCKTKLGQQGDRSKSLALVHENGHI